MASLCSRRRPRGAASLGHVAWSRHGVLTGLPWACCSGHPWARSSCQDQASPIAAPSSSLQPLVIGPTARPAPSRPAGRRQRPTRSESPAVVPRRVARSGEEVHIHPRLIPLDRIAAVHGQPLIRLSRLVQQPSQRRVILVSHRSILVRAVLSPRRRERGARPAKCLALPPSAPGFPAGRPVCSAGGILRPARREARDRCGNPTISGSHADAVWIAVVRPTV